MGAEGKTKGRLAALIWAGAGTGLGLYALAAWSLGDLPGGWQMGLAALILLAAPPLLWWILRRP